MCGAQREECTQIRTAHPCARLSRMLGAALLSPLGPKLGRRAWMYIKGGIVPCKPPVWTHSADYWTRRCLFVRDDYEQRLSCCGGVHTETRSLI